MAWPKGVPRICQDGLKLNATNSTRQPHTNIRSNGTPSLKYEELLAYEPATDLGNQIGVVPHFAYCTVEVLTWTCQPEQTLLTALS